MFIHKHIVYFVLLLLTLVTVVVWIANTFRDVAFKSACPISRAVVDTPVAPADMVVTDTFEQTG